MSSEDSKPDQPRAEVKGPPAGKKNFLDPLVADQSAEKEFQKRYGFKKAPTGIAQRKISATGGKQYFDSGDYHSSENRKDRQAIASHPHAMNPHLAQMRAKAVVHKTQRNKLVSDKSPLAS